jgi:tight adherence protein C
MVLLAVLLIGAALAALTVSLGLVALPDAATRARMLPEPIEEASTGRRMKQIDAPEGPARYVVSTGMLSHLRQNLVLAGHPAGWSMRNILVVKALLPVAMVMFASKFFLFAGNPVLTIAGAVAVIVSYFVPDLLVHSRAVERQDEMQRSLPDVLDKVIISIEAGLGFESALARTAEAGEGPLADELVRTVQDIRLGMSRREAYEALQRRTSSEDLTQFLRGVIQAEEHGSSMSQMVRIQSKEMRLKRKLRAEAKAGRVSVQLLGPLMACIFPVLFIVVLAPGIINAFAMF